MTACGCFHSKQITWNGIGSYVPGFALQFLQILHVSVWTLTAHKPAQNGESFNNSISHLKWYSHLHPWTLLPVPEASTDLA